MYMMKKLSLPLLLFVICALANPFQAAAEDWYKRGDVNGDSIVTITDVTILINYLLYGTWPAPVEQIYTVNGVSFTMVNVKGGTFTMGATPEQEEIGAAQSIERPAHQVTLSDFAIGKTEVTQELWLAVMGTNPSYFQGDLSHPVEHVSWNDCQTFIEQLNALTGETFRLPTEAEWEYAARGGQMAQGMVYAGSNNLDEVAWNRDNSDGTTHPVAQKAANELGLFDMSGNVSEWCYDKWASYTADAQVNPTGPETTPSGTRVNRGGCYSLSPSYCRVSSRNNYGPGIAVSYEGLRLAK